MRKLAILLTALLPLGFGVAGAGADSALFEWAFNFDGAVTSGGVPAGGNAAGFDSFTGLGTITWSTGAAGAHSFLAFFDHEIDEAANTFFNEFGSATGAPAAGQSWEMDEPGYLFGDIYANFGANTLDGLIFGGAFDGPEDVSMAMGWNFLLAPGETASIVFHLADALPVGAAPPGFYLTHYDPDSQSSIYLWSSLSIRGGGQVPEPGAMLLMGLGLAGVAVMRRRLRRS
jgi:hypothetical protein